MKFTIAFSCMAVSFFLLALCGTSWAGLPVLENQGKILNGGVPLDTGYNSTVLVVDWDNDGKQDLLAGCSAGTVSLFLNRGTNQNPSLNGSSLLKCAGVTITMTAG